MSEEKINKLEGIIPWTDYESMIERIERLEKTVDTLVRVSGLQRNITDKLAKLQVLEEAIRLRDDIEKIDNQLDDEKRERLKRESL